MIRLLVIGVIVVLVATLHLVYVIYKGSDETDEEKSGYYENKVTVQETDGSLQMDKTH